MNDDFLDSGESKGLEITTRVKTLLIALARWCSVTSVFGFILSAGGVVLFIFMLNDFSKGYRGIREDEMVGLGLMLLGIAVVFLISKFLMDYARNMKKSMLLESDIHLEKAVKGLRNAMAFIGVIWGLAAVFLVFMGVLVLYLLNSRNW